MELTDAQRAELMQDVQVVLRYMLISLGSLNPDAMRAVADNLRNAALRPKLNNVQRSMLQDLSDTLDFHVVPRTDA